VADRQPAAGRALAGERRHFTQAQQAAQSGRTRRGGTFPANALRQGLDVPQAEYEKLLLENAALKTKGGGLDGYAKFPILA
jgi:hypothetical protein